MRKLLLLLSVSLYFNMCNAEAAWFYNGAWWSNVCVADNGLYYVYPVSVAQPVGTYCVLPNGMPGIVR